MRIVIQRVSHASVTIEGVCKSAIKEGEKHDLSDEMADVLWVLICLANQTGVNLTEAFQRNLEKKTNRDKERHKNNPKL